MNYSISQLIEIYEQELADLLDNNTPKTERRLSTMAIPKVGDGVQFGGQQFVVSGIGSFIDNCRAEALDDYLNQEDQRIVHELESEGVEGDEESPEGEFQDDPYPGVDRTDDNGFDIDDNLIRLPELEAEYQHDKELTTWLNTHNNPDDRETTIAYYRSFHSSGAAFGIYFKRNGLKKKSRVIYGFCQKRGYPLSQKQCYVIAKLMTQFHEIYHHKIEAIASRIEVVSRLPVYKSGFSNWYNRTRLTANCYEETFANCYTYQKTMNALQKILPAALVHNIIVFWFKQQPTPYRNALRLINRPAEFIRNWENEFFEVILSKFFAGNSRFGTGRSRVWNLFKHGLQPYITRRSDVYYII